MEPPSPETSCASDPEEPDWWATSASPDHPGGGTGTPWDDATRPLGEENAFQGLPDESWTSIIWFSFSEESSANTNQSSACSFLKKLWNIVSSHHFQSIWWGDDGNCVMIAEKLFKREVLGRRGPLKIFKTESMRGFIFQLNLHGFCKMEGDSLISASIEEVQAVAAAGSALGKLLFYHNPFFKRDCPNLLWMCTQSAGERKRAPAASPQGPNLKDDHPRRRRPDAQPAVGAEEEENDTQTSATTSSTPTEPRADTTAQTGSAGPSPPKRHCSHSPAGSQEAAPAPSMASPHRVTPPAPNSPFTLAMGLPAFPSGQPKFVAVQVPGAGLPPFCAPWFAMTTLAAPSAVPVPGPPHGQAPTHRHCPTRTCGPNTAAAGDGVGPQRGLD
ncbi:uncharacterized protein ACIBXB_001810 [Morphnus guianensis]